MKTENMTFSEALEAMKQGYKVKRASWSVGYIYNPYIDIPILEPCDTPKIGKYRPKDDRCTNKQIAKRRKRNKNRKTHRK